MELLVAVSTTIIFIKAIHGYFQLKKSVKWISNRDDTTDSPINSSGGRKLYILIPALREQKIITETLEYFCRYFKVDSVSLIVITTQREFEKSFSGPSTLEVVKNYVATNQLEEFIKIVDYPDRQGIMADQLNFALKSLDNPDSFIAVYNSDSRPNLNTLREFYKMLNESNKIRIVQQSAFFIKNYEHINTLNIFTRYLLRASAILQTRWTLVHELPRMFHQALAKSGITKKYGIANCVGHGLFINIGLIKSVGGFPTTTITEDVPLGYILRSRGEDIYPMKQTELANAPETLKGLWDQKYVWFWGPLKYISYFNDVKSKKTQLKIEDLTVPLIIAAQGLFSGLVWILSGPLIVISLMAPLFTSNTLLIFVAYLSIFIYGPLQYWFVLSKFPELYRASGSTHSDLNLGEKAITSAMGVLACIFNSIPPFFTIFAEVKSFFSGKKIYKPKTDD